MIYVLPVISGIFSAFPFINFSLFPVMWVSLVPFMISLYRARETKESVLSGFIFGLFFFGITLFWVTRLLEFISLWAVVAWAMLIISQSLFIAAFSFVMYRYVILKRRFFLGAFAASFIWVSFEWIRSLGPYGVTGGGLGYCQANFLPLIQISSVAGVYGVSFLIVFFNALLAVLFIENGAVLERLKKQYAAVIFIIILAVAVFAYGYSRINEHKYVKKVGLTAALIQPNVPQKEKLDYNNTFRIFDEHMKLSDEITESGPQVIIWPETAVIDYLLENTMLLARVKDFTRQNNVYLIAGTPYFSENGKIFNSLVAFSPAGELVDRFDKKHLVPFGEYLPFRFIFYPLLKNSGNYFEEDFDSNPRVKLLKIKDYTVGAAICFESTFPYIIRERIRSGGDFILVSTNDAWFGDSSAATQHFYAGVFRAVENGCYLVQVANTGISGIIDPCGRVLERTGVGEKGSIIANIGEKGKGTFYLKYGNLLVSLCLLGVASLVFWDRLKGLTKRR